MTWSIDPVALRAQFKAALPETPNTFSLDVLGAAQYVAVVGSRRFPEPDRVAKLVDLLAPSAVVVSGGAAGPDTLAEQRAIVRGLCVAKIIVPSAVQPYVQALFARNTVIVRGSDVTVAFWDGQSNGTRDSIEKALTFHRFVVVALPGLPPEVWCR